MNRMPFTALARVAFRGLGRHRLKTVLTALAVAVSVALYIAMDAWLLGMNLDSRRNIVNFETGAAKLQTARYIEEVDEKPMYENFFPWQTYADALEDAGYACAPRFVFPGTLYTASGSAPVEFIAGDAEREKRVLRWGDYIESGRLYQSGKAEIVLGAVTADKLKTGVPQRPSEEDLEEICGGLPAQDAAWVKSLYEKAPAPKGDFFSPPGEGGEAGKERFILKQSISPADKARYWEVLKGLGRMDCRVAVVIDIKALPDEIALYRWTGDLLPKLKDEEKALLSSLYTLDAERGKYALAGGGAAERKAALEAMLRADYPGAIRHIYQVIDAVVAGVVNSPNPKTNNNTAYLPLDALQDERGLMLGVSDGDDEGGGGAIPGGKVTELIIRAADARDDALPGKRESAAAITAALEARAGPLAEKGLEAAGWEVYTADYLAAAAGDQITTRVMVFILFILSFLGIANTMLLAILERTREIGMMRALGMTDGEVVITFMIEAFFIGLLGAAAGFVSGVLINIPMVKYGLDFSAMADAMGGDYGYRVTGVFRSAWNWPVIAAAPAAAAFLAALMACIPVRRAVKPQVTESLRFS